jgi:hypothetical protein
MLKDMEGRRTHKAIPNTANLLETLLLQPRKTLLHNRIHRLRRMRVISPGTLRHPSHEIKAFMAIQAQRITIEQIRNQSVVSISGVLVGHQLRVLPDADHVREKEDRSILVDCLACRLGDVGVDAADFNAFAGWLASGSWSITVLSGA